MKNKILAVLMAVSLPFPSWSFAANDAAKAAGVVAVMAFATAISKDRTLTEVEDYKNYEIGESQTTMPGMTMVTHKRFLLVKRSFMPVKPLRGSEDFTASKFPVAARLSENGYHIVLGYWGKKATAAEKIAGKEDDYQDCTATLGLDGTLLDKDLGCREKLFTDEDVHGRVFSRVDTFTLTDQSISTELIYSGISGNELHIKYREFKGGVSRAPFYQDMVYDLTKSKTIVFQGIRLEIQNVDNHGIAFRVIGDQGYF